MFVSELRRVDIQRRLAGVVDAAIGAQGSDGGVLHPAWGMPAPTRAAQLVLGVCLLPPAAPTEQARRRRAALAAIEWLSRARRPSGRFDLPTTNPDSAPDTAFVVQLLGYAVEAIRRRGAADFAEIDEALIALIRDCVPGMATGGFHTPNHRWVISSTLAQALALTGPHAEAEATVAAYLAEGFDIDDEGVWIERSAGTYDAINDRSLLMLAAYGAVTLESALAAVRANLELDRALLNSDGTIEVALSSRQDRGTMTVPYELAAVMVWAGGLSGDTELQALGAWVFGHGTPTDAGLLWMAIVLESLDLAGVVPEPPRDEVRALPTNKLWRSRHDEMTMSVIGGSRDFLSVSNGSVSIAAAGVHHMFFGPETGAFLPDSMEFQNWGVTLRSLGVRDPRRPGYDLPLGEPVPPLEWDDRHRERSLLPMAPLVTTVEVRSASRSAEVTIRTESGTAGVPAVIYLDIVPGGVWRTEGVDLRPTGGQTVLLRRGYLHIETGGTTLSIGPGADCHGMWEPRNLPARPDTVRLLIPLVTPIDHRLTIGPTER